jgi:predicted PurR-regulated permease PerM
MWGWLWGVAGALLSMPIAGIMKIVCDNVEPLHMVGVLMGSGKAYVEK